MFTIYHANRSAKGLNAISEGALVANVAAASIFAAAPDNCCGLTLWVNTGTLTLTFTGTTPVAGSVGIPIPAGSVVDFSMCTDQLKLIKGIGGATGYVVFFAG